jgi:hypothetical protein
MTINEMLQWQIFCKKYNIKYNISNERKYANAAINYAKYVNSSSVFEELAIEVHHRYELAIYEDSLLALMKLDAEKTAEENLRKRNITVRTAWEQYQMTVQLCKDHYAQD